MTEQLERLVEPTKTLEITSDAELTSSTAVRTPVLITEAEVVFSTAAAVPLRPTTAGWRTRAGRVALAVRRTFAISVAEERPKPRHHPKRLRYLEGSRMEREMHRL